MCPSLRCFIRRWRLRDRYRLLIRTHGPCTWSRCQIKEQGLSVWSLTKRTQECGSGCIPAHRKFTQPGRKRWTMMGGSTRKEDREKKGTTYETGFYCYNTEQLLMTSRKSLVLSMTQSWAILLWLMLSTLPQKPLREEQTSTFTHKIRRFSPETKVRSYFV